MADSDDENLISEIYSLSQTSSSGSEAGQERDLKKMKEVEEALQLRLDDQKSDSSVSSISSQGS